MKATITVLGETAISKVNQLHTSKSRYLILTMMGGFFVGFGIILIFTIAGLLGPADFAGTNIIMGVSFGIALSLVLMAGADLFTSNNMIMTIGQQLNFRYQWRLRSAQNSNFRCWGY